MEIDTSKMLAAYGSKIIKFYPMSRLAYNKYRGWELPADESDDEGYLIEYIEGGKANHPNHAGYISWSPKPVFDDAYLQIDDEKFFEYPGWVQQLIAERVQNDARLSKLEAYLRSPESTKNDPRLARLMYDQLATMRRLSEILQARITLATKTAR